MHVPGPVLLFQVFFVVRSASILGVTGDDHVAGAPSS